MNHKPILFAMLLGLTALLMAFLNRPEYQTKDLSRAGSDANSAKIVSDWTAKAELDRKRIGVYVDFALILCYGAALTWGCVWAGQVFARHGSTVAARASLFMIGMTLSAVLIDAAENVALLKMLGGATADPWPRIARVTSDLKFSAPMFPAAYAIAGFIRSRRGDDAPAMLSD